MSFDWVSLLALESCTELLPFVLENFLIELCLVVCYPL